MKRNLRFYFALFVAKLSAVALKLLRRNGTLMPGLLAIGICPDFLGRMPRPETIIGITGTNGKTTVSNLVDDVLEDCGYDFYCNREGTNVNTGVASSLIAHSSPLGRPKKKLAVFELDERSAPLILPYITPDILLINNLFRDSYKRNAHIEFIVDILNAYIPDSTKLILNADDLICSGIKPQNERIYFDIAQLPGETAERKNIVCDINGCPVCGGPLNWSFIRYHHIGKAECPSCGFCSPDADYHGLKIDSDAMQLTVMHQSSEKIYPISNTNLINVYNTLAATTLLQALGLSPAQIQASLASRAIDKSRYSEETAGDKKLIMHLAKGQNPIACSRTFENIRNYPGTKSVILFLDDHFDAKSSVENTAWFYDTDFEFLNDPDIQRIVAAGARHWDTYVRLLIAGVPEECIVHLADDEAAAEMLHPLESDTVFILYDVYTIDLANRTKERLMRILNAEGGSVS